MEVTIVGEVPRPGVYALTEAKLSVALVTAGVTTMLVDLRAVQVRRPLTTGDCTISRQLCQSYSSHQLPGWRRQNDDRLQFGLRFSQYPR
ncbi:MAG: hypothetical protein HC929_04530 [Leptolyngbyaceae cyanobacterium SM2_5_2]|nr:hypothetical protein [Leptolyngbyaceae cyanobacterium SM2_5_2]